jgi:uncharacterized protein YggE
MTKLIVPKLIAAILAVLTATGPALAQPASRLEPSITVQGQGRVEAKPDYAKLTAEVVTRGATLQAATNAHRERAQRAAEALRKLQGSGVEIERSTFRLDEDRRPMPPGPQPRREEIEYRAVTTFELKTTQLDKLDAAISEIAGSGLFELRGLRYAIAERNPGIDAARRAAVEDARQRAEVYAQAAGVKLGDIVRIEDTEPRMPREMAAPMMRASVAVMPPEALTVTSNVTMTWRIGGGS